MLGPIPDSKDHIMVAGVPVHKREYYRALAKAHPQQVRLAAMQDPYAREALDEAHPELESLDSYTVSVAATLAVGSTEDVVAESESAAIEQAVGQLLDRIEPDDEIEIEDVDAEVRD